MFKAEKRYLKYVAAQNATAANQDSLSRPDSRTGAEKQKAYAVKARKAGKTAQDIFTEIGGKDFLALAKKLYS